MPTIQAETISGLFLARIEATPDAPAYLVPEGGGWKTLRWSEVGDAVLEVASGLLALGLQPEERCAILSATRFEWILADFGIHCAAGATTTIYPSSTGDQAAFILRDSEAAVAFVENPEQLEKLAEERASLPALRKIVLFDGEKPEDDAVISLAALRELGRARRADKPEEIRQKVAAIRKDALSTVIYTSGTTGKPKGVELTHDCWVYEGEAIDALGILNSDDVQLLWLPLAHALGKVLEMAQLRIGFSTGVDGRVERLVENLASLRPTFVAAVPRIFEKVHNKVILSAEEGGPVKATIFRAALEVGLKVAALKRAKKRPSPWLAAAHALADKLVFAKVRKTFGGRIRYFVSGSAPLSREIAEFFHAMGLIVLEGYGLTETSAASFVNRPDALHFGTVGPPLPGTEAKIAEEDGEILIRCRGVMRGYHHQPEATAEVLTPDGWLKTGDIGRWVDGSLEITDRKKDLIKTSGGKYVAPQVFEVKLKAASPYVSQTLVHGNNRNFCAALITLDAEATRQWAQTHGLGALSPDDLAQNARLRGVLQASIDEINAGMAPYERVRAFAVIGREWSVEAGELTPTLKVKRKVVEQEYRDLLEAFYAGTVASHGRP